MYTLIEEHPDFMVVYKNPGVDFHTAAGEPGLFARVREREQVDSLYPVHRLDKVTSGLLVMAKTAEANKALCAQFHDRQVEKYYLAIGEGKVVKKQGLIRGDMERTRRGAWKLNRSLINPAMTQFFSTSLGNGKRLFLIKPCTGRTHQIRVALKSLGSPILGDDLYGKSSADRTYLHAFALGFSLKGRSYFYQALPTQGDFFLDQTFQAAVAAYRNPRDVHWPALP